MVRQLIILVAIGLLTGVAALKKTTSTMPSTGTGKSSYSASKTTYSPGKSTASTGKSTASTGKTTASTGKSTALTGKSSTGKSTKYIGPKAIDYSTTPSVIDPSAGTKPGNPGAKVHLCNKTVDAVHVFAADMMCRAIKDMVVNDLVIPAGLGQLTIKSPRVSEAKFDGTKYEFVPPNRIKSRFLHGSFVSTGFWQYQSMGVQMGGGYKASISDAEMELLNQLGRTNDGKPTIQMVACTANISKFRVEITGAGSLSVLESCADNPICNKILEFYENTLCQIGGIFVQEVLNRELSKYPNRVDLIHYQFDYGVQNNQPIVASDIEAGLEGKSLWRGPGNVPFNAPELVYVEKGKMIALQLGDYAFNTLLHQAHSTGYRYSVADLVQSESARESLKLNCSGANVSPTRKLHRKGPAGLRAISGNCLGSQLANLTGFGQYGNNDTGDIVFKSNQKAPWVFVQSAQQGYFECNNGVLEIYGPDKRQIARVGVQALRGQFTPKLAQANVTGVVKIDTCQLSQSSTRSMTEESLDSFAQFVLPLLTDMFNAFFDGYSQFPVPLPDGYNCTSPDLVISPRTIQVNCDIATKKTYCACKDGFCFCNV